MLPPARLSRLVSGATRAGAVTAATRKASHAIQGQPSLSNQAVQRRLRAVQEEDAGKLRDAFAEGTEVRKQGLVASDEGVNLRPQPDTATSVLALLPLNTPLFVDRELPGGWYSVVLEDGATGYVKASHIAVDLPEPGARLHRIQPGESALDIVKQHYKGDAIRWGQDERFYVNVLVLVNGAAKRKGIYTESPGADWGQAKTKAGSQIWIPSLEFAKTLHGKVSSGSISYEVYSAVRDAAIAVGHFLLGQAAFVAGLLHGALESLWDILVGLVDLAELLWSVVKNLFKGELLSKASSFMEQIQKLKLSDLIDLGLAAFDKRWNDPDFFSRWHFRGWLVGYLIMEVLVTFYSAGVVTGLKWLGKAVKIEKLLVKLPEIAKLASKAKSLAGEKIEQIQKGLKKLTAGKVKPAGVGDDAGKLGKAGKSEISSGEKVAKVKSEPLEELLPWSKSPFKNLIEKILARPDVSSHLKARMKSAFSLLEEAHKAGRFEADNGFHRALVKLTEVPADQVPHTFAELEHAKEVLALGHLEPGVPLRVGTKHGENAGKLPKIEIPDVEADVFYRTADLVVHLDEVKISPNAFVSKLKEAKQFERYAQWIEEGSKAGQKRVVGVVIRETGPKFHEILDERVLRQLGKVAPDPKVPFLKIGARTFSLNELQAIYKDGLEVLRTLIAANPGVRPIEIAEQHFGTLEKALATLKAHGKIH